MSWTPPPKKKNPPSPKSFDAGTSLGKNQKTSGFFFPVQIPKRGQRVSWEKEKDQKPSKNGELPPAGRNGQRRDRKEKWKKPRDEDERGESPAVPRNRSDVISGGDKFIGGRCNTSSRQKKPIPEI